MNMDFHNGSELLELCKENHMTISQVMEAREIELGGVKKEAIDERLNRALEIMDSAVHDPVKNPKKSIGGLIGGEAKKIMDYGETNRTLCGDVLTKAISFSMAVLEVNSTMGLIVAAPTAGSAGIVPGTIYALHDVWKISEEEMKQALLNASAVGYILMRNASVAGAEAGCQAEVGAASAMAASALTEILGGSPDACLQSASIALSNLLGLVCDPIAGLVESPCQSRNAIGVSNAFTCAQLALSGVTHPVPFDEMAEAMYKVGRSLPFELRETALGGNASTPTGCRFGSCMNCPSA